MPTRSAAQAVNPLARFGAGIARLLRGAPQTKASSAGPLIALETSPGQPVWAPRDYATFAREGVMQNAIVYRSVRMIAEAAASVPLLLYEREREIIEHPLLDLLSRPSPGQTGVEEILVSAIDGSVVSQEHETPKMEKAEAKKEKAEKKKNP